MVKKISKIVLPLLGFSLMFNSIHSIQATNQDNDNLSKIKQLIRYGALAPSSHNAQMWKVKIITANKIQILIDQHHILPQVDPENRESFISLGAFIENIIEAAPYFNLQADVWILASNHHDPEIAELTFNPKTGQPIGNSRLDDIKNRHTIRIPYQHEELHMEERQWFHQFGTELHYFSLASQEGNYIQEAIIQATRQQTWNDNKQKELAGLFRFSKKEAHKKKDGLTPDAMGLSGITKWFVTTFFTHKTVMSKSFRQQSVTTTERQAQNCTGFVLLSSADSSVAGLVNSGRSLEKFLILATGKRLAVQPMSSPLEESPWKEEISQKVNINKPVQMILRVGYVKNYGHPVSLRRAVPVVRK